MNFGHILFSFDGRINRGKFWLGVLLPSIALMVLYGIVLATLGSPIVEVPAVAARPPAPAQPAGVILNWKSLIPLIVAYLGVLWSAIAVGVKRAHDRAKSGWWVLISLIPIVGPIWYLIEFGCLEGTRGPNPYGPDPLGGQRA